MNAGEMLLIAMLAVPLTMAAGCVFPTFRRHVLSLLPFAALPAVPAALLGPAHVVVVFPQPFRMAVMLDRPGAILLGGAALLWTAAGAYASSSLRMSENQTRFAISWLLTLAGSLGLFIVADVASFYLFFTMASLAAYGLIAHDETERAFRAGSIYVSLALVGEAFLLLALVLLATSSADANPLIHEVVRSLGSSPHRNVILSLMLAGCALKLGLCPLHVWLPLAHPAAPIPASAVLSGILVKAGVIGLIRFLPFDAPSAMWGDALTAIGLLTAYWGAAVGITQSDAKSILAYSTVSQMGLIATIAGTGLSLGDMDSPVLIVYYGIHHMLAKGSLFLAVGVIAAMGSTRSTLVTILTCILAISLGGLPLTSGALAKLVSKPLFGYGLVSWLVTLAAIGSTALMLHFLAVVLRQSETNADAALPRMQLTAMLAVSSTSLTIPWLLYPDLSGNTVWSALQPASLWKSAWPVALGFLLAAYLWNVRSSLPAIPQGDIIRAMEPLYRVMTGACAAIERSDSVIRLWPVACALLVSITILLIAALAAG